MNKAAMINYILAWENDAERIDAMTDSQLTEHFEAVYDAYQGMTPPPECSDLEPTNYNHIEI